MSMVLWMRRARQARSRRILKQVQTYTITTLTDAKALAKIGGIYKDEVEATNSQEILDTITVDDYLYGVPYTTNTWFMFYDKSVFSEDDIKNLDTMLEKGVVSGQKAVDVTNYLIDLANNPNFKIDADGSGIAGLRDGSIKAMFTGSWDANGIKESLGDNMGVASLPTYTLNGEEVQMYAYAGSKAIGVNSQSRYPEAAVQLAVYLGSAEAQRLQAEDIASDELVNAQNDTFNYTSIMQPFVSQMNNCWTPVENLGKGIRNGSVTHDNAEEQTEAMNDAMNSDGLS